MFEGGDNMLEDRVREFIRACKEQLANGNEKELKAISYLVNPKIHLTYWDIADICQLPVEVVFELQEAIDHRKGKYSHLVELYRMRYAMR
ncbi:MAG: hypothetical protein A6D91_07595 [Bacillaceae bacterium G1]|nr:MAG: hypothetical protein A6D91_07595 [Bacillaceae bacterium G1]